MLSQGVKQADNTLISRKRLGSTFLEVQVAMIILAIGTIGVFSMSALQARQTAQLSNILPEDDSDPAFNRADSDWARKLGVYTTIEDKLEKLDDPESLVPLVYVLDEDEYFEANGGGGHGHLKYKKYKHDWFGWTNWNNSGAYRGKCRYHYSQGNVGSRVEYRFHHVKKKRYYELFITYPSFSSLGTAIPVQIYDHNDLIATTTLNQRQAPSDISYAGKMWHYLGTHYFDDDDVKVRLYDGPNSRTFIIADAMMIRTPRPMNVISLAKTASGGATVTLEVQP